MIYCIAQISGGNMDIVRLENSDLVDIGRAADMLWLCFRRPILITAPTGTKEVSEYALHIQCPWRFIKDDALILGARDIYDPDNTAYDSDPEWNWDEFDRDISEQSVFFVNAMKMKEHLLPLNVKNIILNGRGDLKIEFNKNVVFELFITGLRRYEYWRFIDFNRDSHFVVFGLIF
jgi:hypothetical protein